MARFVSPAVLPVPLTPKVGATESVLYTSPAIVTATADYGFGVPVVFLPPMGEDILVFGITEGANSNTTGQNMHSLWAGELINFFGTANVVFDSSGNMIFGVVTSGGTNLNGVWKMTPGRQLSVLAGGNTAATTDGTGTAAQFNGSISTALASDGNYYLSEQGGGRIRKMTAAGVVTTLAGNATNASVDGTGTNAQFGAPRSIVFNTFDSCLYVYDANTYKIRRITLAGVVTTVAGVGTSGFTNGNAGTSSIVGAGQLASDGAGGIYFADNQVIRKMDTTTSNYTVTTLAGAINTAAHVDGSSANARFYSPWGIVWDSTNQCLWVHDTGTGTASAAIRKVTAAGTTTTLTPLAQASSSGQFEGPSVSTYIITPAQSPLSMDPNGSLIMSDGSSGRLRRVNTLDGRVTHIGGHNAGTGVTGILSAPATLAIRMASVASINISSVGKQAWLPFPYPVRIPAGNKVSLTVTNMTAATAATATVAVAWAPISAFQ